MKTLVSLFSEPFRESSRPTQVKQSLPSCSVVNLTEATAGRSSMLFWLVSTLLAGRPILARAAISLALAFLVELSQLYQAPWIDSVRQTTLGGLGAGVRLSLD